MSFVRFSSDNWTSDVYAFESDDGFEVYVAGARLSAPVPPLLEWGEETELYWQRYEEQMRAVAETERVSIDGPHDGAHFVYASLAEMRAGLVMLQEAGYHVPAFVFESIDEELNETQS